jgi:nucleobase:cation symporter-1, NCS1 family
MRFSTVGIDPCSSVDYWFVRRGNVHMPSVFLGGPESVYWYWHGFNIRAYAAWLIGLGLVVHGVAGALKPGSVNAASTHIYSMGFLISTLAGGISYYVLCLIWPVKIYPDNHAGESTAWEHMGPTEGFFEDDDMIPDYILERGFLDRGSIADVEMSLGDSTKDVGLGVTIQEATKGDTLKDENEKVPIPSVAYLR